MRERARPVVWYDDTDRGVHAAMRTKDRHADATRIPMDMPLCHAVPMGAHPGELAVERICGRDRAVRARRRSAHQRGAG